MSGTIYDFCEAFHISISKARKMEKAGWLRLADSSNVTDPIRASLANGDRLTAAQLVELIEHPSGLLELGKYAGKAERELAALGNPQAAPREVVANIMEAAKGEPEALLILVDWLKSIIGATPAGHAFIAVRLLLGIPEGIRKFEGPRIPRALLNARNHPDFAGWWHIEASGKNRNVTIYQKTALDL